MFDLKGRVAIVTGGNGGIGLGMARGLARAGARVVIAARNEAKSKSAVQELEALGPGTRAVATDVTDEAAVRRMVQATLDAFGRLDVLVNNAGFGRFRSIADTTLEQWRATLAVNLDSVFLGTKHAMPLLARSGRGAIVNMSSIRGLTAGPNAGAYCAAKAGVRLFTKVTALECAETGNGVRANSVHPGHVETPLTAPAYADPVLVKEFLAHTPLRRFAQPQEVAEAIVFLASDESSYMTGSELAIDGGVTAQ